MRERNTFLCMRLTDIRSCYYEVFTEIENMFIKLCNISKCKDVSI